MSTQHTPAPWYNSEIYAEQGKGDPIFRIVPSPNRNIGEELANINLIIAAPELLAALIELDQWAQAQQASEYPHGTFSIVQEAINKARGV